MDGYRLPTEAEWEYACRAGTDTPFHFGQHFSTDWGNYDGNFPYHDSPKGEYRRATLPVASFPPNPWGLYDMHGNVWEWCHDRYRPYPDGPVVDPVGPEKGLDIVARGGSWASFACYCRSAFRFAFYPFYRNCSVGFRVAMDI
jgi:formylglycine-generating enzyme required for sulfatase activity